MIINDVDEKLKVVARKHHLHCKLLNVFCFKIHNGFFLLVSYCQSRKLDGPTIFTIIY